MATYYNMPDAEFLAWMTNFTNVTGANTGALGLSPSQQTALVNAKNAYSNGLIGRQNAADAAKAATLTKDAAKDAALELVRTWANQWQNNPAIPKTLIQQLGLPVRDTTPSPRPIFTPSQLSATGFSNGVNKIRWNRNGNQSGCTFVVEYSRNNGTTWAIAGVTNKARFDHTGQPPKATLYRVRAERRGQQSPPTDPVALFFEGDDSVQLQLAA
jgi:hypothetical protein